jgi:curved DNA-binding protein CbpA
MSSSAGKFQDYYALLGVEPKSDVETIQKAYAKFAQKYHPGNTETGDKDKFDSVNQAYEVLSDPSLRREFDKLKGVDAEQGAPKFSSHDFFEALGRGSGLRIALLCILYDRRQRRPFTPSLSMRHVESMVAGSTEELNFALWYLKQKNLAESDDKSSLQITVEGMDYVEHNRPTPELVMPFIKVAAHPAKPAQPEAAAAPPPEVDLKPGLSVLRRVMARK